MHGGNIKQQTAVEKADISSCNSTCMVTVTTTAILKMKSNN